MGRFDFRTRTGQISAIIQGQGATSVDADAQAYFDRVTAAGGSLNITEQNAVNTLTLSLKSAGIWTLMKAIYPMVGASAAACSQNLKSSSFTGTFTSGWTFQSTGVTGNGTSAFFNTNIITTADLPSTNYGIGFYKRIAATSPGPADIGTQNANLNIFAKFSDGNTYHRGINTPDSYVATSDIGFYHQYGKTTGSTAFYRSTRKLLNGAGNSTNSSLTLCMAGNIFSPLGFNPSQYNFLFASEQLTDTQATDLYTAVQGFQTSLSRQV